MAEKSWVEMTMPERLKRLERVEPRKREQMTTLLRGRVLMDALPRAQEILIYLNMLERMGGHQELRALLGFLDIAADSKELVQRIFAADSELKLSMPPGLYYYRVAELLVSVKRMREVYEPLLADWHEEYFYALDQGRGTAKMIAIRIRHTWAFIRASGVLALFAIPGVVWFGRTIVRLLSGS